MEREVFKRACAQGGEDMRLAFRQLVHDYGRALLRECSVCLRDPESARDALQNALLKIWKSCASYRGESELFPWLKRVARTVAIDELRASAVRLPSSASLPAVDEELDPALPDELPGPEALTASRLALERYRECEARFREVEPEAAAVIRWIAEDELSIEDVARLLNRTPQATRQYLYQCRRKARQYLAPWYAQVAGGEG
jgi:RNA polymerase sigma factor (sigma-70 family)